MSALLLQAVYFGMAMAIESPLVAALALTFFCVIGACEVTGL